MSVNDGFLSIIVVDEDTIIHDVDQALVLSFLLFDIIELFVSHINDLSRQGMTLSKRGVFCARIIKIAIFLKPSLISASKPPFAIAAPAMPPTRA